MARPGVDRLPAAETATGATQADPCDFPVAWVGRSEPRAAGTNAQLPAGGTNGVGRRSYGVGRSCLPPSRDAYPRGPSDVDLADRAGFGLLRLPRRARRTP